MIALALFVFCQPPAPAAPWDFESRLSAAESRLAALEAKCADCPCTNASLRGKPHDATKGLDICACLDGKSCSCGPACCCVDCKCANGECQKKEAKPKTFVLNGVQYPVNEFGAAVVGPVPLSDAKGYPIGSPLAPPHPTYPDAPELTARIQSVGTATYGGLTYLADAAPPGAVRQAPPVQAVQQPSYAPPPVYYMPAPMMMGGFGGGCSSGRCGGGG